MAKAKATAKRQNKVDVANLSPRDRDVLSLPTKDVMKKYKIEKQSVYDRRFALNKKFREAGVTAEQILNDEPETEAAPNPTPAPVKKTRKKRAKSKPAEAEKVAAPVEEKLSDSREVMVVNKQVPVIMKPIEINFDNFSIKLNGVPKKISVNPDTNAIEIDL